MRLIVIAMTLASTATVLARTSEREKPRWIHTEQFHDISGELSIEDSFGTVEIRAWDSPDVRLEVEKETNKEYAPDEYQNGVDELERVQVISSRTAGGGLRIRTEFPSRKLLSRPLRGKTNVELTYRIQVPRQLAIRVAHDVGEVRIEGSEGNVHATARVGEIHVETPGGDAVVVDAQVRIGNVDSDFEGRSGRRLWMGEQYRRETDGGAAAARKLYLRVGVGQIEIRRDRSEESFEIPVEVVD